MLALEARALSFRYPTAERPALDGLSLELEEGSATGLLGPNGAGKTTFLNLVCGLQKPQQGRLSLFGMLPTDRQARRALGYCPQELALYPKLTAAENLRLFGKLAGLRGRFLERRIDACLATARLQAEADSRVEQFSGGMKRRLNLGLAIVHDPQLLLLDEPTVGVDSQSRNALFTALEELIAAGTTVLYATHYMEEVERLCPETAIVDHGRIIAAGPTRELVGSTNRAQTFRIRLDPRENPHQFAAGLADQGIRVATTAAHTLDLSGADLQTLTAAISQGTKTGQIVAVETSRPTLEERFLELTGAEVRDG